MEKKQLTKKSELIAPLTKITPPSPPIHLSMSLSLKYLVTIALTAILTILTLGCPVDKDGNIILDKTQITGSISYQDIQVDYGNITSSTVQLTNITPSDATNSDYLYSVEPPLPDGVTLNLTNGTITATNNAPGFSNTYTITATVTGNDPQYKGSVTGNISINIIDTRMQITGSISYQDIQVDYGTAVSSTAQLTNITPSDATNSDYLYSVEPPLPDGVTLNLTNGTITATNNAPGLSNTYTITATVTGNDPQYKGSVTGNISINIIDTRMQITGSISYQDIQVDYGTAVSSTAQLTGITPPDAANSDYLYSVEPPLPNGVTLNLTNGTITVANNVTVFSNTYLITATVTGNDPRYKGSITGSISIKMNHFSGRQYHDVVVFNNELYLIGGYDGSFYYNDVWKSSDGATWTKVIDQAQFSGRYSHSVVVFNNELYFIGGESIGYNRLSDVWKSSDGVTWTEVTGNAQFPGRFGHSVVVFNNELYLIGGLDNGSFYLNDVWKSSDGIDWTEVTATQSKFSARSAHSVVVFSNELYLIGGLDSRSFYLNDVWKSPDGATWTEVTTAQPKFSGRSGHSIVEFNNKLYLIGGFRRESPSSSSHYSDVWKSSDGIDWTEVTTIQFKFSTRRAHRVVEFNNELYLIGGYDGSFYYNDVWKSPDGIDWEQKL